VVRRAAYARHLNNREEALSLAKALIDRLEEMNRRVDSDFSFRSSVRQPLFPPAAIQSLPDKCFGPGDIVCLQGENGDEAYTILEGQFSIHVRNADEPMKKITTVTTGSTVGYLSVLMAKGRRTATVIAQTSGRVKRISRKHFFDLLEDADVRKNVIRELFGILGRMNRCLSADAGRERVFSNLKRLLHDYFQKARLQTYFDDIPPLTSLWIALELGIEEGLAADLLKQLLNKSIIESTESGYELTDPEKLLAYQFRTGFRPPRPAS
jgi:CRP-like cAMP-binding protein